MSSFPGPPSYSEFLAAEARREREENKSEAQYPAVERSPDLEDIIDKLLARAVATEENRSKHILLAAAEYIKSLHQLIDAQSAAIAKYAENERKSP